MRLVWVLPIIAGCVAASSLWLTLARPRPKIDDTKARTLGFQSGDAAMSDIRFSTAPDPLTSEADFQRLESMARTSAPGPLPLAVAAIGRAPDDAARRRALSIVAPLLKDPSLRGIAETAFEKWARSGGLPLLTQIAKEGRPNTAEIARTVVEFHKGAATPASGTVRRSQNPGVNN